MQKKTFLLTFLCLSAPIALLTLKSHYSSLPTEADPIETCIEAADIVVEKELPQQTAADSQERFVTISNKINKKMITYHKGFFSLTPEFNLSINGTILKPNAHIKTPLVNDTLTVSYDYNFMGHKKGKKSITFQVPKNTDSLDVTFSWKEDPRISLGNAKALEVKEIY